MLMGFYASWATLLYSISMTGFGYQTGFLNGSTGFAAKKCLVATSHLSVHIACCVILFI